MDEQGVVQAIAALRRGEGRTIDQVRKTIEAKSSL
jgi:hypothetical protein